MSVVLDLAERTYGAARMNVRRYLFDKMEFVGEREKSLPLRGRWLARKGETEEGQKR